MEKSKVYVRNTLLSGFIFCGNCGARYVKKYGKKSDSYICYSRLKTNRNMIKDPTCKKQNLESREIKRDNRKRNFTKILYNSQKEREEKREYQ